jgi:hypothetical protein
VANTRSTTCVAIAAAFITGCRAAHATSGSHRSTAGGQPPAPRDRDWDQDAPERAEHNGTSCDATVSSAEATTGCERRAWTGCDGARLAHNPEVAGFKSSPARAPGGRRSVGLLWHRCGARRGICRRS